MDKRPFISIIIPTYNRPQPLAACLQSLARLAYPPERLEIIVINDGGVTRPEVDNRPGVIEVTQPNAGPAAARNNGAAQARGDFLAFLDDDCQPDPSWLACLAAQLEKTPDVLVGGRTLNALPQNAYATASQLLVDYLYAYYNQGEDGPRFFTSNNFALAAPLFAALGGFDTTFPLAAGEDRDFCDRWRQAGHGMVYVPEAVVYHAHDLQLRSFWRQHLGYGRGAYHFHQRRRARRQEKVSIEPLAFYKNLVFYPFQSTPRPKRRGFTAVLLGLTQAANVMGYVYQRRVAAG